MARLPIALPPGVVRQGTALQSKGRFYDALHTRWYDGALGNTRGWRLKTSTTLTGAPRAALAWKTNAAVSWLAIGTHSKLYVMNVLGTVSDITPTVDWVAGRVDATGAGGYGSGTYGTGAYGTPRPGLTEIVDATQQTLQQWGEDLLSCSPDDRKLRLWDSSTGVGTVSATVTNSPACSAVVVTEEGFAMALATATPRTVSWCDQRAITVWTPSDTNQAGDYELKTAGRLMCGASVRGATLLLTDQDVHTAQYVGGTAIYSISRAGDACGVISRQGVATFDQQAMWMSPNVEFWLWNGGGAVPLECDVLDYIRLDINLLQMSKVSLTVISAHSEVEVRYCSASATEIDRCVVWNYKKNYWTIGRAPRTCGADRTGSFQLPILVSSAGSIYEHEVGWDYGGATPYGEGGPLELGNGDNCLEILGLYPDTATTVGAVNATFFARRNANDTDLTYGPHTLSPQTDLRFGAGQLRVRWTGAANADWRVGAPKLEAVQGDGR